MINKGQHPTRGIANKGFGGMRRVVARFNFSCILIGNRPQSLTGHTATVVRNAKKPTMRQIIDDIVIDLEIEENGVRVISGENNVILPNLDLESAFSIIENNYRYLSNYYKDISDGEIESIDIKLICIKIVLHYLYMYNMWRKSYEKESNRDIKFIEKDLNHPQTHDIIFNYFKVNYPDNWIDKCSILMDMTENDCRKKYIARELFNNR